MKFDLMKLHGQVKALIAEMEPGKTTPTSETEPLKAEILIRKFKF